MPNLTPDFLNVPLNGGCVGDRLVHAGAGPRPVFIWLHGGGGYTGDHYRLWVNGQPMNRFADYLNGSSLSNFDVVSLGVPQYTNDGPTSAGHLPTMTDATLGVVWPTSAVNCVAGINHVISLLNPSGVILGGFSYGGLMAGTAMLSGLLTQCDGFVGYYIAPDARKAGHLPGGSYNGDLHISCGTHAPDCVHWSQLKGIGGVESEAAWNAIPPQVRQAASIRWYIDNGHTAHYKPMWLGNADDLGDHRMPYGDPVRVGAQTHDSQQHVDLVAALTAHSLAFEEFTMVDNSGWESATEGDPMNAAAEAFMLDCIS